MSRQLSLITALLILFDFAGCGMLGPQSIRGGQAGLGPRSGFAENLVPLEAGIIYEESPTIL